MTIPYDIGRISFLSWKTFSLVWPFASTREESGLVLKASPSRLPNELLRLVIEYVDGTPALATLCQVSKIFQAEAERLLYREIRLSSSSYPSANINEQFEHKPLLIHLRSPRFAAIVTKLRISLMRCHLYNQSPSFYSRFVGCKCTRLDNMLGYTLYSLTSLSALHIDCNLCPTSSKTRHLHIENIETTGLEEFSLSCNCSGNRTASILTARCMGSVERIKWSQDWNHDPFSGTGVDPKMILPNLKMIVGANESFVSKVVPLKNITRLSVEKWTVNIHQAVKDSTTSLEFIHISGKWHTIIRFLDRDPTPYRNVQHIGCLFFLMSPAESILRDFDHLSALPLLSSIQVLNGVQLPLLVPDKWDQHRMVEVQKRLPRLSKLYLTEYHGPPPIRYFILEVENNWNKRLIPKPDVWSLSKNHLKAS